jgi:hypothetical protein
VVNTKFINYQLDFIQTAKCQMKLSLHVSFQNKRIIVIEYSSSYLDVSHLFRIYILMEILNDYSRDISYTFNLSSFDSIAAEHVLFALHYTVEIIIRHVIQ